MLFMIKIGGVQVIVTCCLGYEERRRVEKTTYNDERE